MLQEIVVTLRGDTIVVGIYGEAALRAEGHNIGIPGRLPQRHWFDLSLQDADDLANEAIRILVETERAA
jgi:hypothetical protein